MAGQAERRDGLSRGKARPLGQQNALHVLQRVAIPWTLVKSLCTIVAMRLPMMPIRDFVVFPGVMTPFIVGRKASIRALREALAADKKIFLATQHDTSVDQPRPDEIYTLGTVANIVQS